MRRPSQILTSILRIRGAILLLLLALLGVGNLLISVSGFGAEFLCSRIPGLTSKQREICENAPDSVAAIGQGTALGLEECQSQFRHSRWNCTMVNTAPIGPIAVLGTREAAFLYAISSAGVAFTIAKACSLGQISTCGCAPPKTSTSKSRSRVLPPVSVSAAFFQSSNSKNSTRTTGSSGLAIEELSPISQWRWGGCSADIGFAVRLSRIFLDSREVELDARSYMNLHNNKAGRKAVQNTLQTQCKCHGLSGSCTLKTCWVKLAPFKAIGDLLKERYLQAKQVIAVQAQAETADGNGNRPTTLSMKRRRGSAAAAARVQLYIRRGHRLRPPKSPTHIYKFRRKRARTREGQRSKQRVPPKHSSLVYLEDSVSYCDSDPVKGVPGTKGRECTRTYHLLGPTAATALTPSPSRTIEGTCEVLCCGRGYSTHEYLKRWKCRCKFNWCCSVSCDDCEELVEVYTCN